MRGLGWVIRVVLVLQNLFGRLEREGRNAAVGLEVASPLSVQICDRESVFLGRGVLNLHV